MSTHSFSCPVALLNEAQTKAVRSMRFASFLKDDLKHIPGKSSKWLVESFDPYAVCFRLLDGQKFPIIAFNVYVTLGVPLGGIEIIKITKSSMNEEYNETEEPLLQFILDKLINSVRHYKESTVAKGKGNNDLCASSFSPTLPLDKPDGEAEIPGDTLLSDSSIIIEKEEQREDVVLDQPKSIMKKNDSISLGLSQPDNQSPVPQTTFVPDLSTAGVNEDDGIEDDDDGAPLRFPLKNTSQVNCELNIKKAAKKKPKEGDKPSSKKGEVRKQSIKIKKSTLQ
ncbi:hypothetical protein Cgig2_033546 [Carnegiea gigantea]|uniref:Uncharacterized protein n=1 Tax=Carnegiea gigantea TaxID=171969 RepID=A0A9Q1K117_9CARY|nr:hypothetical protein Cgig2_033546 [Carnegiea gigantea]